MNITHCIQHFKQQMAVFGPAAEVTGERTLSVSDRAL